jgi:hypothetical protein
MDTLEKNISFFIENQFPQVYQEEGPVFIQFVKSYFEWLESAGNPIYHTRNFLEYRDIDETPDEFLVYFKEMYLKGISIESYAGTRLLVKNSLDLYRSKGTEQGLDLLFRAEYGVPAAVYYPSTDIFKLSQGKWVQPKFIQVTLNDNLGVFDNKEIIGLNSKAVAFVEKSVLKIIKGQLTNILYVSAVSGSFRTGEKINVFDLSVPIDDCPFITGSVDTFDVDATGSGIGFKVGDEVVFTSNNGEEGIARVANVISQTGTINFKLQGGGYGFSSNTKVVVSDKTLNIFNANITGNSYFIPFESVTQMYGTLNYLNGNGTFTVGQTVSTYFSNGLLTSNVVILSSDPVNSTFGALTFSTINGTVSGNYLTSGNATANISVSNGISLKTATGSLVGVSTDITLQTYSTDLSTFTIGALIYQVNTSGTITATATIKKIQLDTSEIIITNYEGVFLNNTQFISGVSVGFCSSQKFSIGVIGSTNAFISSPGNRITSNLFNGEISFVSSGTGATVNISSSTLLYTENIALNTDYVAPYLDKKLANSAYGFPSFPTANLSTTLYDALAYANNTYGRISTLQATNPGKNYNSRPFVYVYDPLVKNLGRRSIVNITIFNPSQNFTIGEVITQASSNARGLILSTNSTTITAENLRVFANNDFTGNNLIIGTTSGATANVFSAAFSTKLTFIGSDAIINPEFSSGEGAVTKLIKVSSGYNFNDNEQVTFFKGNSVGSAIVNLGGVGIGKGYYQDQNSFVSNRNKIRDGYYFQEYSYDVISSIAYDKYKNLLKQIMHVAGTKNFFTFVYKNRINSSVGIKKSQFLIT